MALESYSGSFNVTTAVSGTVKVQFPVGRRFTPKAILFFFNGRTESGQAVGGGTYYRGFGICTGTTARYACSSTEEDAIAASDGYHGQRSDALLWLIDAAGATTGLMDLSSFDSDGFTLVIDDQFDINLRVGFIAWGGTTLTDVAVGDHQYTYSTPPFTNDITAPNFQPDVVFCMGAGRLQSFGSSVVADSHLYFGVATGATEEWSCLNGQNDNSPNPYPLSFMRSGALMTVASGNWGAIQYQSNLDSFLSTGFRIQWTTAINNPRPRFCYLAMKGGDWLATNFLSRTDTNDIAITGLGSEPSGGLLVSVCEAEHSGTTFSPHDELSTGAFSATDERVVHSHNSENVSGDTEVEVGIRHDAVYGNIDTSGAWEGYADIKSIDSDGATFVMDDTDPSAYFVGLLLFGPRPSAAVDKRPPDRRQVNRAVPTRGMYAAAA